MTTLALNSNPRQKKLIELPTDVCRRLAVQAAAMGVSVKKLIENMVINSLDDCDDEALYGYLCKTCPDGEVMISEQEQTDLLSKLRTKAKDYEV
ncbi:MAG: hypothetical protein K2H60_15245 [Muribaculaceae bacterium]|nr:hypothetical protein [Muribaculaceae bacterium]